MNSNEKTTLYFGCIREAGHYLHQPNLGGTSRPHTIPGFPWRIELLDTGLLKNRKVRDRTDGGVHWTFGGRPDLWHAFFWWDRSVDSRSNSNSGLYVRGFGPVEEAHANAQAAFEFGCSQWPDVVSRQAVPLHLVHHEKIR